MSIDIGAALLYLSDLAPLKEQKDYEQRIMRMFENQLILGAFEKKLEAIRHYPENGNLYHAILKRYYFDEHRCSDGWLTVDYRVRNALRTGKCQRNPGLGNSEACEVVFSGAVWDRKPPMPGAVLQEATPKNHAIDHGGKQTGHMKHQKAWQRRVSAYPGFTQATARVRT